MVNKTILDKKIIDNLLHKECDKLEIKYNLKNKRAFYKIDNSKWKAICINRVINL